MPFWGCVAGMEERDGEDLWSSMWTSSNRNSTTHVLGFWTKRPPSTKNTHNLQRNGIRRSVYERAAVAGVASVDARACVGGAGRRSGAMRLRRLLRAVLGDR